MIIKGGSRQNGRFFAKHLTNAKDNERVRLVEFRGFAKDTIENAFREMKADAAGSRCQNYFYHADMNPRENEHLTDEQWSRAVDTLEKELGLEGQPRFVVEHEKNGRVHRHVVWSRIDADTMTARSDSLTYGKHEAAARQIEQDCELQPVPSVLVEGREGPRPTRRARDWEGLRGSGSGLVPDDVTKQVTALWQQCDTGTAFKTALEENGYILCRGDRRDFCIVDPAGDDHSLARRIDGTKAAAVRERMKDIDRDSLPTVEEGREMANAWGDSSDASATVRNKILDDRLKEFKRSSVPNATQEWDAEHMGRLSRDYEPSVSEQAAHVYGQAVYHGMRGLQDAYWQIFIGGKPRTDADKLHDLVWGEDKGPKR
jgi:hypothetical protein